MIIARRDFLKMLGVAAGATGLGGCGRRWLVPDRLVEQALRGPGLESHLQTICGLCEGGCGLSVRLVDGLPVGLKGNPNHPLNRGGLCPVGQAGLEVLYARERLQGPLRRDQGGRLVAATWEEALGEIGERLGSLVASGQGEKIALLSGERGQLFQDLEGRFLAALGSPNLARLDGEQALAFELTQGLSEPPGFDLSGADLVLSLGLDLFEDGAAPLHAISALVGSRPTESRAAYLHAGTRLSPSAAKAEEFVGIQPGSHGAFALGIAHVLVREGNFDRRFVAERTFGFEDWTDEEGRPRLGFRRLLLERYYPDRAAQLCGCQPARIVEIARRFAASSRPLALAGGEATQGSNATWTAMSVHALNALLGAFDRDGGVVLPPPIPLTRLAEEGPAAGSSLFGSGASGGGRPADPIEALAEQVLAEPGRVEILFVLGCDPVHRSAAGDRLRQALERIPLVIALASFPDETAASADFVLPTHVFLEGWQGTTTPATVAFSTLGVGQPVIEPLFDTRHPGDVLLELAHRASPAGERELPWTDYEEYLRQRLEGLVISGQGSVVTGSFEESWVHFLEERGWRFLEHKSLDDFWSDLLRESGWWNPVQARGDWARMFRTPSGRYEFHSALLERRLLELGAAAGEASGSREEILERAIAALGLEAAPDEVCLPHFEPPRLAGEGEVTLQLFRPITARGELAPVSPMVMEMFGYPHLTEWQTWVELSPATAHHLHLGDGDLVAVESDRGSFEAVVRVQPGARDDVAHVPLGLGHRPGFGAGGGAGANPASVLMPGHDSLAGTRSLTSTRARLRRLRRRAHGGPAPLHGGHA